MSATVLDIEMLAAPKVRRVSAVTQTDEGEAVLDLDPLIGLIVFTLEADNTGTTVGGDPEPGQTFTLSVRQGAGGSFAWTPPAGMVFAGSDPGTTATVADHRDIYTFVYDGEEWNETGRAMDVG